MKRYFSILFAALLIHGSMFSNNLTISNVSATTTSVTFNISWDNSWNISNLNYDAVWIFIKSQDCSGSKTWDHVNVAAGGHTAGGGVLQVITAGDNTGVFIKRSVVGAGNIPSSSVTLIFQTPFSSIGSVNFDVNGIEMVYIPQEAYTAGDNSTNTPGAYVFASGGSAGARVINSEAALAAGFLANPAQGNTNHPAIPAAFPKGFAAFYCMKYEITQSQYAHFLNLLTHTQQTNRTIGTGGVSGTGALVNPIAARNSIKIATPSSGNPVVPAVFGNDLNNNAVYDEPADGGNVACNYLSWDDLRAYLDWSALRPMTELEYEKACRGPEQPITGGYPWGNNIILGSTALSNVGQPTEVPNNFGIGLCNYVSGSGGPNRVGFAATNGSGRTQSGGSYFGVMEMAGNVWEQTFTVGGSFSNPQYHITTPPIFAGTHGNGSISSNGDADTPGWGNVGDVTNSIIRGGGYNTSTASYCSISDRFFHMSFPKPNINRNISVGGRGVRTN
jgi:formylglycine-generating enzyme required for sulfatase activity